MCGALQRSRVGGAGFVGTQAWMGRPGADGRGICQAVPTVSCVMCGVQWLCCDDGSAPLGRGLARLPMPRELHDRGARPCDTQHHVSRPSTRPPSIRLLPTHSGSALGPAVTNKHTAPGPARSSPSASGAARSTAPGTPLSAGNLNSQTRTMSCDAMSKGRMPESDLSQTVKLSSGWN